MALGEGEGQPHAGPVICTNWPTTNIWLSFIDCDSKNFFKTGTTRTPKKTDAGYKQQVQSYYACWMNHSSAPAVSDANKPLSIPSQLSQDPLAPSSWLGLSSLVLEIAVLPLTPQFPAQPWTKGQASTTS